jgi:hypothetical protein
MIPVALVLALPLGLAGCGWLHAGGASNTKPSGFVLRGYVTVAGAPAGTAGSPCQTPAAGVSVADEVRVTDPPSTKVLGTGSLGAGVLAVNGSGYECNFPFSISAVPGGHKTYSITVGNRSAVSFPAEDLRSDKPAVISVR